MQKRAFAQRIIRVGRVVDVVLESAVADDLGVEPTISARVDVGFNEGGKTEVGLS